MRPWEETWEATESGTDYCNDVINSQSTEVFLKGGTPRFRLALAAPEMARLLLDLQWVDTSDGEYRERCPVCQNRTMLPPDGRVGVPYSIHDDRHAEDCKLIAVLRKAGVLP